MLLKRRRCSVLYNHWDVFLRYCFKILGLSNCVVCLQESSEQGWKKDRVLKRSEFTHMRFYIEINQKWSDVILVFFYFFFFYLTCHFFFTYDRFYQVYTSFRFNHGGFCSLFYQTHVNDVSFHVFLLHFSWVYLLFLITFVTFHADFHFFPVFYICGQFSFFFFCIICSLSSFLPWLCNTVIVCRPCLLVMDSLKLSYHDNVCRLIREWVPPQHAQRTENKPNPHLSVMLY